MWCGGGCGVRRRCQIIGCGGRRGVIKSSVVCVGLVINRCGGVDDGGDGAV